MECSQWDWFIYGVITAVTVLALMLLTYKWGLEDGKRRGEAQ